MVIKGTNAQEAAQVNNWLRFYSANFSSTHKPIMSIVFRNNNGLESYWDYTASSAGRAGMGYINNYTGNLVWIRSDLGFDGNRMPVSISHVYNSNDSMYNTTCIQDNQGRAQYADYTLNDIPGTATNYLKTLAYGNGDGVEYTYDNQGRVITEEYGKNITSTSPTIGKTVSYGYDNSGYLASVTDSGSGITTKYFYDFAGRTSATEQKKNGSTLLKTALSYDGHGRLSRQDWTVGAKIGALAGSAVPGAGNIVGGIAGFVIGASIYVATDMIDYNGKTARGWLKGVVD